MCHYLTHHQGPGGLAHVVLAEVHIGLGVGEQGEDQLLHTLDRLLVVETGLRHHGEEGVGSKQSSHTRNISERCVTTLDQQGKQGLQYGDGGLDDR